MEKRNKKEQKEILCYIQPDRPLAFNFYEATNLAQLRDKEPTSGVKKEKKEEEDKKDLKKVDEQNSDVNFGSNNEEEERVKGKVDDVIEKDEGSLAMDNQGGAKKFQETKQKGITAHNEVKKDDSKKKIVIKYKKYTNSLNVSNNKLTTISGLREFLMDVLPELTFTSKVPKVDLLQWIDISRNKLTCLESDISQLKFLKILYAHGNNIQELGKVTTLRDCQSLTALTL